MSSTCAEPVNEEASAASAAPHPAESQRIARASINYFYQCQASALGTMGCSYFKLLDMEAEGRGPCLKPTTDAR